MLVKLNKNFWSILKNLIKQETHSQNTMQILVSYQIYILDLLPNINDIDYLCGAKYRGQLQGQFRHGIGSIMYSEKDEPIIGYWNHDICMKGGV